MSEICIAWIHNKPILTSLTYPIRYWSSTQFKLDWGYSSFLR
ncbi:MAG TPA: hypothetical protein ACFYD4_03670 [Candidatus Wunengus sp. YC61]